jgi:hypothetical protein
MKSRKNRPVLPLLEEKRLSVWASAEPPHDRVELLLTCSPTTCESPARRREEPVKHQEYRHEMIR